MKRLYDVLKSLKTTVVLIVLMLPYLIAGTIVPQNKTDAEYLRVFSEGTLKWLKTVGFTDAYHAPLFHLLVALFTLNLLVCMWDGFRYFRRVQREQGTTRQVWLGYLGIVFHLSMLVLLAGFILTAVSKKSGTVVVFPGETETLPNLPQYQLKLHRFWIDYMDFHGQVTPKAYVSDVELLLNQQPVVRETINVNHPLKYRDLTVYQSSYVQFARIAFVADTDTVDVQLVRVQSPFVLPTGDGFLILDSYKMGDLYPLHGNEKITTLPPKILVYRFMGHGVQPIGTLSPDQPLVLPNGFRLVLLEAVEASGFQYRVDRGVPLVYLGGILFFLLLVLRVYLRAVKGW